MTETIKNACALTGHRILQSDFSKDELLAVFIKMIEEKLVTRFYCGMAIGFDLTACEILCKLKNKYPQIKIIACIPCPEQSAKFGVINKKKYDALLSLCDEQIVISPRYDKACMHLRNRYMVDRAQFLIAYIRNQTGGTASTVKYAVKQGREIIKI